MRITENTSSNPKDRIIKARLYHRPKKDTKPTANVMEIMAYVSGCMLSILIEQVRQLGRG